MGRTIIHDDHHKTRRFRLLRYINKYILRLIRGDDRDFQIAVIFVMIKILSIIIFSHKSLLPEQIALRTSDLLLLWLYCIL